MRHIHHLKNPKVNQGVAESPQNKKSRIGNIFRHSEKKMHHQDETKEGEKDNLNKHPQQLTPVSPIAQVNFQQDDYEWIARTWLKDLRYISNLKDIICIKKAIYEILFEAQLGFLHRNIIRSFQNITAARDIGTDTATVSIKINTQSEDFELTQQIWVHELRNITDSKQIFFAKKTISDIFFEAQMGTLHKTSALINRTLPKND